MSLDFNIYSELYKKVLKINKNVKIFYKKCIEDVFKKILRDIGTKIASMHCLKKSWG